MYQMENSCVNPTSKATKKMYLSHKLIDYRYFLTVNICQKQTYFNYIFLNKHVKEFMSRLYYLQTGDETRLFIQLIDVKLQELGVGF